MTTNALGTYALDVDDVEYVRHGNRPLLARLFKPRGTGPFPLIIELHGGAWCRGDRLNRWRRAA
jgi:acetyl esterase/lipase